MLYSSSRAGSQTTATGQPERLAPVAAEVSAAIADLDARHSEAEARVAKALEDHVGVKGQIASASKDLAAMIASREADIGAATAESRERLMLLTREVEATEDRLASGRAQLESLRKHLIS